MAAWTVWILLMCAVLTDQGSKAMGCGTAPRNTRTVGGADAKAGSWPWMVSVHINIGNVNKPICGGTLISDQWVLTAAHCIITRNTGEWLLYLGRDTQSGPNTNEVSSTVSKVIVHPRYNSRNFNNDIALMKLSSPVTFTNYIRPVCLASRDSDFHTSTSCLSTGWGQHGSNVPINPDDTLQEVQTPVVGNNQCRCNYKPVRSARITRNMICAGEKDKGPCKGDSGGPLQCKEGAQWVQAGITSFGVPCALGGYPEVYARVSEFEKWIKIKVRGASVGFVTFTSSGTDSDKSFSCPRSSFTNVTRAAPNPTTTKASKASTIATELTLVASLVTVFLQYTVAP